MTITYIVTINPILENIYLNIQNNSLNLQSDQGFNVIYYNQTLDSPNEIIKKLKTKPLFDFQFINEDKSNFFGKYPIWDLYKVHSDLLEQGFVGDYFMSVHMEEFFDIDYTKNVKQVLLSNKFDILLGNLARTKAGAAEIDQLPEMDRDGFDNFLKTKNIKNSPYWIFSNKRPFFINRPSQIIKEFNKLKQFHFNKKVKPNTKGGYLLLDRYNEDIYIMKKDFAIKLNWFLKGHSVHFEDIHINWRLGKLFYELTRFPILFTSSKVYHLSHKKYYYQIENNDFTNKFLLHKTFDPILVSLQEAIRKYKAGEMTLGEAVRFSRINNKRMGCTDVCVDLHKQYLSDSKSANISFI